MEKEKFDEISIRSRSNTGLFMEFVRKNKFFSTSDEDLIQNSLEKLKKKNPPLHKEMCIFLNKAASEKKDEKAEFLITQELLYQLKTEQSIRLQALKHEHQEERSKRKTERCRFMVSTIIAVVTSCAAIVELILLAVKESKC